MSTATDSLLLNILNWIYCFKGRLIYSDRKQAELNDRVNCTTSNPTKQRKTFISKKRGTFFCKSNVVELKWLIEILVITNNSIFFLKLIVAFVVNRKEVKQLS